MNLSESINNTVDSIKSNQTKVILSDGLGLWLASRKLKKKKK